MRSKEPRLWPRLLLATPSLASQKAEVLRRLDDLGASVIWATHLRGAVRQLQSGGIDLLLCDLGLSGRRGLELVRTLRDRGLDVPALLLCDPEHPLLEAADLGAFRLELPISAADLVRTISTRLEHRQQSGTTEPTGRAVAGGGCGLELRDVTTSVAATTAKNQFGMLLGRVLAGDRVVITKHNGPAAVLISFDEYRGLHGTRAPNLDSLRREFDIQMKCMQELKAANAGDGLFGASEDELAESGLLQARTSSR